MLNLHFEISIFNFCWQVATDALALGPVHTNTEYEILETNLVLIDNIRHTRHQQGHNMHSDWMEGENLNIVETAFSKFNF